MIDIIIFLFCILLIFSVLQIHSKLKNIIFISFGVVLICLAGFRGSGIDRDYISYKWAFLDNDDPFYQINEPSFRFISFIVKEYFNSNILFLFLLYAVIAITLKFYAIKQLSEYWFISLFIYFCYSL